jgi:5-methylcytosine-specific restriction protein A
VAQPDVTAADVLTTIEEFDRLGRTKFLTKYHYGESRSYFLNHGGRFYDSKAIVGVAHQIRHGQPLTPQDFSGGDATVAALLRSLGFVVSEPNPPWTRDEIVLACDLVRQHDWRALNDTDPAVIELSDVLRQLPIHPPELRGPTFRNPNGVARKTVDIATQHPDYPGVATHGNRNDAAVLQEFLADSDRMAAIAAALRSLANSGTPTQVPELDLDDATADEGGLLERHHLARERNPTLRSKKIAEARRRADRVACEVCGFDFQHTYGERGIDFIECHHRTPLHISGATKTNFADLALLCSNCHRMIHRGKPWLTIEQLTALMTSGTLRSAPPPLANQLRTDHL